METSSLAFSTVHSDLGFKILNLEPCTAYVGPGSQIPDIVMKIPSPVFGIGDPRIPNPGFQFEMQLCTTERCGSLGFLGGGGMSQCCENTPSLARRLRCMRSGAPLGSAPGWARYHFHGIRTEDRSSSSSGMLGCTSSGGVHNVSMRFFSAYAMTLSLAFPTCARTLSLEFPTYAGTLSLALSTYVRSLIA